MKNKKNAETRVSAVTVTESARLHIIKQLESSNKQLLLFGVKGGGCAGFAYFWEILDCYDNLSKDEIIELGGDKKLIVDSISLLYTLGCVIDYKNDFSGSQLVVTNPNAKSGCGCGTSISF
jgi:iron-sulfur cluster insertion protein